MKGQNSIEYLWAYVWTFVVLIVIVAAVALNTLNRPTAFTYSPSACYLTPELTCDQIALQTNNTGTRGLMIFTDGLGTNIRLEPISFIIYPYLDAGSRAYLGGCVPANVPEGGVSVCNVTLPGFQTQLGQELSPRFSISYQVCRGIVCDNEIFNTTGSGTVYVSAFSSSGLGNLKCVDLAGHNLEGVNLSGENYQCADFQGANLQDALLQQTNLQSANLQGANLQQANLSGANLYNVSAQGANFQNANLDGDNLQNSNMQGANFQGADLQSASLQDANLRGANFQSADLHNANLVGADTAGANFNGAIITGCTGCP